MSKPQMRFDLVLGWIALGHTSFIGWDILEVTELEPGTLQVQVRRRAVPAHWIPESKRITRLVRSSIEFVPLSYWQSKPIRIWEIKRKPKE